MPLEIKFEKYASKKGISQQFIADYIGIGQSKFNRKKIGKLIILLNDLLEICTHIENKVH